MSRIGKLPVAVPSGVTANLDGQSLSVKGPKGELSMIFMDDVVAKIDESGSIAVQPRSTSKRSRQAWGMQRTLASNLVEGVTSGFKVELEINGVGYRAAVQGKNLQLTLGFSHEVLYLLPDLAQHAGDMRSALRIGGAYVAAMGCHTDSAVWPRWRRLISETARPSRRTRPDAGFSRAAMILSNVLLPDPLRPTTPKNSPLPTSNESPRRTRSSRPGPRPLGLRRRSAKLETRSPRTWKLLVRSLTSIATGRSMRSGYGSSGHARPEQVLR